MRVGAVVFVIVLAGQLLVAKPEGNPQECKILVVEMSDDLAVFEVFLPKTQAQRKAVVHTVTDDGGSVIVTQKFGTANGHYRIAMIASYVPGREYTFLVDGRYTLKFRFDPSS